MNKKRWIVSVVALLGSVFLGGGAKADFAAKVDYGTGSNPYSVTSADMDGDGDQDLAVANYGFDSVSVLKNNGNGTFATKVDYGTGREPWSVTSADMDGDGDQDLATANYADVTVSILINNTPSLFSFTDLTNQSLSTLITSNSQTVSGFSGSLTASVSGDDTPHIEINNSGSWVTSGSITSGQSIKVRITSSSGYSTAYNATVTIGDKSDVWSVTTRAQDTAPDAFSFTNQTGVAVNSTITSNAVTLANFDGPLTATCGTGCTAIARNGTWGSTSVSGFVSGDTIAIRQTSSASNSTATTATVTVGSTTSGTWSVTTLQDTAPDQFTFTDLTNQSLSTLVTSNSQTVSGFTETLAISVAGSGSPQIEISNSGSWVTSGSITSGQSVKVRLTSSSSVSTAYAATVTVGDTSDTWSVTTTTQSNTPSSLGPNTLVSGGYAVDSTPTLEFTQSDADAEDSLSYHVQIDTDSNFGSPMVDYTSALMSQGAASFTVGQAAGFGTYATGSEGQTLSEGSYYWRVQSIDNGGAASSFATANGGVVAFVRIDSVTLTNPQPADVEALVTQGVATATGTAGNASQAVFAVPGTLTRNGASALFPQGTQLTKPGGGTFDFSSLNIQDVTNAAKIERSGKNVSGAVRLGVTGAKLSFSSPVTVSIPVASTLNGRTLGVASKSYGDGSWTEDEFSCTVSGGLCAFQTTHATDFSAGDGTLYDIGEPPTEINLSIDSFVTLSCTDAVTMSPITGTGFSAITDNHRADCTVTTNNSNGYKLDWQASSADMMNSTGDHFAAYSPVVSGTPETWNVAASTSAWGAKVAATSENYDSGTWGANDTYAGGKWLNVSASPFQFFSKATETDLDGEQEAIVFGAQIGSDKLQPTGTYTVNVTITATTL